MLSEIENEFRHSLRKGYNRLRQTQGVWLKFKPVECVLELLGDPHVLRFNHSGSAAVALTVPLVYVIHWYLKKGEDLANQVSQACDSRNRDASALSLYKRTLTDRENLSLNGKKNAIHEIIAESLSHYLLKNPNRDRLLVDHNSEDHVMDSDHVVTSESWKAIAVPEAAGRHWLFGEDVRSVPDELQSVNRLIRITFPLGSEAREDKDEISPMPGREMITLILGFAFRDGSTASDLRYEAFSQADQVFKNSVLRNSIRKLTFMIASELPRYYSRLENNNPSGRVVVAPAWYHSVDRLPIQAAVDELHRDIARLALRTLKQEWEQPEHGFKFVVTFRQLDETYHESLRYTPSVYNLHALGHNFSSPKSWREQFETKFEANKAALRDLFVRDSPTGDSDYRAYANRVAQSIEELFRYADSIDSARIKVTKMIEESNYLSNLTPGYWVMRLNHPEIIQGWLKDPRAKNFSEYPPALLAWESIALPDKIYYSPITDGLIPLGVCAIDAAILHDGNCSAYDLQEIIDRNAQRLRYILCDEQLRNVEKSILEAFQSRSAGMEPLLMKAVLKGFRNTAYYHFGSPEDFFTKLTTWPPDNSSVMPTKEWNTELAGKHVSWLKWGSGCEQRHLEAFFNLPHTPASNQAIFGQGEEDFFKDYIKFKKHNDKNSAYRELQGAKLHRISFTDFPEQSILVLIADPQHGAIADDLLRRFTARCDSAFQNYKDHFPSRSEKTYDDDLFVSYNSDDRQSVLSIVDTIRTMGEHLGQPPSLEVWVDTKMQPGYWNVEVVKRINRSLASVVFVGPSGVGRIQAFEVQQIHHCMVERNHVVIPILLPGGTEAGMPDVLKPLQRLDFNTDDQVIPKLITMVKSARPPKVISQTA